LIYISSIKSNPKLDPVLDIQNEFEIIYSRLEANLYPSFESWVVDVFRSIDKIVKRISNPIICPT
jgi:hypothetical protein